ncbi:MAG: hypothetical protein KDD11_01690 [Acidobacteria bacterium]|nr:hypothetical protein [Acidobacteriota bacterium]
MCHQTVGLVQGKLEAAGIATTAISLLPWITRRVGPPRALVVPYPLGYPLGAPGDPPLQRSILRAALALLPRRDLPVLEEMRPEPDATLSEGRANRPTR